LDEINRHIDIAILDNFDASWHVSVQTKPDIFNNNI